MWHTYNNSGFVLTDPQAAPSCEQHYYSFIPFKIIAQYVDEVLVF